MIRLILLLTLPGHKTGERRSEFRHEAFAGPGFDERFELTGFFAELLAGDHVSAGFIAEEIEIPHVGTELENS